MEKAVGVAAVPEVLKRMAAAEIIKITKRETARSQAETEIKAHGEAIKGPSHAGRETRTRRQRRPAAETRRIPPADPRRSPDVIGAPHPAETGRLAPPAIMERRPTPRVIRIPIPALIRPKPVPVVAVRLPRRIHHHDRRLPAPTVGRHVHPGSVRRQ